MAQAWNFGGSGGFKVALRVSLAAFLWAVWGFGGADVARGAGTRRPTPTALAVKKVLPSVVSISSEKKAASSSRWPFSPEESSRPRVSGMGTGVIIDGRGYILTNYHVVDKVQGIEVHLHDGSVLPARAVQRDEAMDLAVLKVDAGRELPAATFGRSSDLMLGEDVITIGNAFGYENTVAVGIVSALGRNVTLSDEQVYRNLIQTDAAINPGNSGGPLINIDGELVGINVAVRAGAQGIGFALPIDDVKRSVIEMLSTRRMASTWHGLVLTESAQGDAHMVVVSGVEPGSPAEAAGFKAGDELERVGELAVTNAFDLERGLLDVAPGRNAACMVRRGAKEQMLGLKLRSIAPVVTNADDLLWRTLGLKTTPVTPEYVAAASPKLRGGLYVQSVLPNGPGAKASIQKGDILVGMNVGERHWETIKPENILVILRQPEVARARGVQFYIVRRNGLHQGSLNLADLPNVGTVSR